MSELENYLAAVEAAVLDADASLSTSLGGQREITSARLWRGQVLVDWEADPQAGGCLLRPSLLRRLIALHGVVALTRHELTIRAPGRVVLALTEDHAALVRRLGGARRVELLLELRFTDGVYRGGQETYRLLERGQRVPIVQLSADVTVRSTASPRSAPSVLPRRSHAPR